MSGTDSISDALRMLAQTQAGRQSGQGAIVPGQIKGQEAPADPKTVAFQMQMRMARQAMDVGNLGGLGEEGAAATGLGMESALMGDVMLMDALSTMARLTGQENLLNQKQAPQPSIDKSLTRNPTAEGVGAIAARFESGEKGIAAIGYDKTGGTSYGKFQISSRAGTMGRFLNYLDERAPELAGRLRGAGPANTGSAQGRMPGEWGKIAQEQPERFEKLQTEFIKKDHYQPAREKILEQTGVDIEASKPALREALFSTAVQHGATGAARIFNQAIDKFLGKAGQVSQSAGAKGFEQALVSEVYAKRQNQFGGSTESVRASVRGRLKQEKELVLAMLDKQGVNKVV